MSTPLRKSEIPQYVRNLIDKLIMACEAEDICLTGFAFRPDPPMFIHMGNVSETKDPAKLTWLHERLCEVFAERTAQDAVDIHYTGWKN